MLTSLIMVIILQCICILKHQIVHFRYIQSLFFNYTPIKLKEGEERGKKGRGVKKREKREEKKKKRKK